MQVILLEKIASLGDLGDKVAVKSGFARNYLLPKGKATTATPENIEKFEKRRNELEKIALETLNVAKAKAALIEDKTITIESRTGSEGRLFGSINSIDIVNAAKQAGIEIERNEVRMPEGAIRQTGEFVIPLTLHSDVQTTINVNIIEEA